MRKSRVVGVIGSLSIVLVGGTLWSVLSMTTAAGVSASRAAKHHLVSSAATTATFDLTASVQAGGTDYQGSVDGQIDFANSEATATVEVPGGFGQVISAVDPGLASKLPAAVDADTSAQIVVLGGDLYLSMAGLPIGSDQWVELGLGGSKSLASAFGTVGAALENVGTLAKLTGGMHSTVTSLGTQEVNGVSAEGYSTSVDLSSLLSHIPGVSAAISAEVTDALGESLPVEVWAEPHGPVVQLSVDSSPPAGSTIQSLDVSLDMSNWGEPVTITAPPASETLAVPIKL